METVGMLFSSRILPLGNSIGQRVRATAVTQLPPCILTVREWNVKQYQRAGEEVRGMNSVVSRVWNNIAALWTCALLIFTPAFGEDFPDAESARQVIERQLQAFASDDAVTAFSFAAPIIRGSFGDADTFFDMVKRGYQPVYRNKDHSFQDSYIDEFGLPSQRVRLNGLDGISYEAIYTMELQFTGEWKISGCRILRADELGS
jgi:Domain of unknown function (DUF4864)